MVKHNITEKEGAEVSSILKQSNSDKVFTAAVYFFLAFVTIIILYPLIYIVSASFSSADAVLGGEVWLFPVKPTLIGYSTIFESKLIMTGYANSFFYTAAGTLINVVITVMAAYPLSRKDFKGRNFFSTLFVITMLFSGGLIPNFLLVRNLGLYDTRWAMLLPTALSVWNMIITKTYFQTSIPNELTESAYLDGCSDVRCLTSIIIPLSGPILAVISLFYAVANWNSYFNALLYLGSPGLYPLQIILRNILITFQMSREIVHDIQILERMRGLSELLRYSIIVVASVPVLIIYPFVQKSFIKGVMIGSLKG